jgi:hypothetical protein
VPLRMSAHVSLHADHHWTCHAQFCVLLLYAVFCFLQERMHGIESKRRNRSVEETLAMFKEMQVGR